MLGETERWYIWATQKMKKERKKDTQRKKKGRQNLYRQAGGKYDAEKDGREDSR